MLSHSHTRSHAAVLSDDSPRSFTNDFAVSMMIKENRSASKEVGVSLVESAEMEQPETVDTRRQLLDPPTTSLLKVM